MMLRNIFKISETVERSLNYSALLENINIFTRINYTRLRYVIAEK